MSVRGKPVLKTLDRSVGPLLLRALGVLPRRALPTNVSRIGVLKTAAIGDTLLLTGVLKDLVTTFRGASVTLVTGTDNADAGALAAAGAAAHVTADVRAPLAALRALRRAHFDVLVDAGSWPRFDALLTTLSGARFRVGFRTAGQDRHFAYDVAVDHSAQRHEIDNYRALFASIGVRSSSAPLLDAVALPELHDPPPRPFVVLHPQAGGTGAEHREWPTDRWVALARRLRHQVSSFVVTSAPGQASAASELGASIGALGIPAIVRTDRLIQVAALLRQSAAVVSINTGIMHLSAQLGVPTVGLHGPTSPERWGPVGPRTRAVTTNLPGCGYLNLGFEYDGRRTDCMLGISVDAVERAVCELTGWQPSQERGA